MPENIKLQKGVAVSQQTDADVKLFAPDASLGIEKLTPAAKLSLSFYDAVVGTAQDLFNAVAQFTSLQAAVDAVPAGSRILVLKGAYAGNVSINKRLLIQGQGYDSEITGNVTLAAGSLFSTVKGLRANQFLIQAGADGNIIDNSFWVVVPSDLGIGNDISGITL